MSRDRATSVIDLGLKSRTVSRPRAHKLSDPGPMFVQQALGKTVRAERSRLISTGEIEEVPEPGGGVGAAVARRTILKLEANEHVKKVAVCHFQQTLFYHIDQVCFYSLCILT